MKISADQIGKRFSRTWVFRNLYYVFAGPDSFALLGRNGSGKSTFLRILAGMQVPSQGKVHWEQKGKVLEPGQWYSHLSYSAPGMSLPEELSLREFLDFHFRFKSPLPGWNPGRIIETMGLAHAAERPLEAFSSGMLQRVKLAQAIFSDTPVLFLDEPCTNLDDQGVDQYREWMDSWTADRLVFVASNDPREYEFCRHALQIQDLSAKPPN